MSCRITKWWSRFEKKGSRWEGDQESVASWEGFCEIWIVEFIQDISIGDADHSCQELHGEKLAWKEKCWLAWMVYFQVPINNFLVE